MRITWLAVTSSRNWAWAQQAVSAANRAATVAIVSGMGEFGLLLVDLADPPGHIRPQAGLQGLAFAGRPRRHQVGDVLQAHPDALGPLDEHDLVQRGLTEHPVAVVRPPGR